MEHRYGVRYLSAIDVYVRSHSGRLAARGRLLDVSISGAFVSTSLPIAPLSSITLEVLSVVESGRRWKPIEAQVIRRTDSGIGIDSATLQSIERALAQYIGPIARVLIKRAAARAQDVGGLCAQLAREVQSDRDRARFLDSCRQLGRRTAESER